MDISKGIPIGKYDSGVMDLSDKLSVNKKTTVSSEKEALDIAKKDPGAELIVERKTAKSLSYDVYDINIDDKGEKIAAKKDIANISFIDRPLAAIEKATGTSGSIKATVVAENGEIGEPISNKQFDKTNFDKMRETLGLDNSKTWFKVVDKIMGVDGEANNIPPISEKEIDNMKKHVKPGDIVLCGQDGSFIHGLVFVGKNPELQAQLEKNWGMPKGSLKDESIIMHSLIVDADKEVEFQGKKQTLKASGAGVHLDTMERYTQRHPRDAMMAISVKDASDADRQQVIEKSKQYIGRDYDRAFDTFDHKTMYCTEFVATAWSNAPNPPDFNTQKHALISYPQFILDKLPKSIGKSMQDGGVMHNEMIMTDGLATSKSVTAVWANKDLDKSEFMKKHERWADAVEGKTDKGYAKMVMENVPQEAAQSAKLVETIKSLSERTRNEMKADAAPKPKK